MLCISFELVEKMHWFDVGPIIKIRALIIVHICVQRFNS